MPEAIRSGDIFDRDIHLIDPDRPAGGEDRGVMNDLWPSGVASLALKNLGHADCETEQWSDPDPRGSCGARRASDLERGTGVNGSVRAMTFGRDNLARAVRKASL